MALTQSNLARKFAQSISEAFASPEYRESLLNATPQSEHKEIGPLICDYLDTFLKSEL